MTNKKESIISKINKFSRDNKLLLEKLIISSDKKTNKELLMKTSKLWTYANYLSMDEGNNIVYGFVDRSILDLADELNDYIFNNDEFDITIWGLFSEYKDDTRLAELMTKSDDRVFQIMSLLFNLKMSDKKDVTLLFTNNEVFDKLRANIYLGFEYLLELANDPFYNDPAHEANLKGINFFFVSTFITMSICSIILSDYLFDAKELEGTISSLKIKNTLNITDHKDVLFPFENDELVLEITLDNNEKIYGDIKVKELLENGDSVKYKKYPANIYNTMIEIEDSFIGKDQESILKLMDKGTLAEEEIDSLNLFIESSTAQERILNTLKTITNPKGLIH